MFGCTAYDLFHVFDYEMSKKFFFFELRDVIIHSN